MEWFAWLLITLHVLTCMHTVSRIGQSRDPITPHEGAISVGLTSLLIWGIVRFVLLPAP